MQSVGFGRYSDVPVPDLPLVEGYNFENEMAVDGSALGLEPCAQDSDQGNVTGLELSEFEDSSLFFATFTGPSFSGHEADIFVYDQSGPLQLADLDTFALAAHMGLDDADIIDALALSDVTYDSNSQTVIVTPNGLLDPGYDQVLFSLAPGSPSLTNGFTIWTPNPADILVSSLNGNDPSRFLAAAELGLLPGGNNPDLDNLDALDIRPTRPGAGNTCVYECIVLYPDTFFAVYAWAVPETYGHMYLGCEFSTYVHHIDDASVRVNGSIVPVEVTVVADPKGRQDWNLKVTFDLAEFVQSYLPLWDVDAQMVSLSGEYNDGVPFSAYTYATFIGHMSGDLTGDGVVNIADLSFLVAYFFAEGDPPRVPETADVNGDCAVNIIDVTYLVSYLFDGGSPPIRCPQ